MMTKAGMIMRKTVEIIKDKAPESTAAVTLFTPLAAFVEKNIARMPHHDSQMLRASKGAYTFIIVPLILEGRKYFHKILGYDKNTDQKKIDSFDRKYAATVSLISNFITTPALYCATSNENDGLKIFVATIGYTIVGALIFKPGLYFINVFKDLLGVKPIKESRAEMGIEKKLSDVKLIHDTQQYIRDKAYAFEDWLTGKSVAYKRRLALGFVIGAAVLTYATYEFSPAYEPEYETIDKVLMNEQHK